MSEESKHCIVCGRKITDKRAKTIMCSYECRRLYHQYYKSYEDAVRIPFNTVAYKTIHEYMQIYQGVPFDELVWYLERGDIDSIIERSSGNSVNSM